MSSVEILTEAQPPPHYLEETAFMGAAIRAAAECLYLDEHPIGAAIVRGDELIAIANNRVHRTEDATQHAEMVALQKAAHNLGNRSLQGWVLYSTHEPCAMCTGAAIMAGMEGIIYGTSTREVQEVKQHFPDMRWKSNTVRAIDIVSGSTESNMFVAEGFMSDECWRLIIQYELRTRLGSVGTYIGYQVLRYILEL